MPPLSRKLVAVSLFTLALACVCLAALAPASRRAAAHVSVGPTQRNREEPRASVYGRAVYEGTSRPVRRARVMLVNTANARPELTGLTDGRGEFRIAGLPPGEYVVAVTETVEHGDAAGARDDDIGNAMEALVSQQLLVTFYPSATSAKEATTLKLDAGDERGDVDITIPERELRTVSGYVRGRRDKRAVARARVTIVRKDDELSQGAVAEYAVRESGQNVTTTDDEGRWQFKEIPDGQYAIIVKPREEFEPPVGSIIEDEDMTNYNAPVMNANVSVANANVTITNANVTVSMNSSMASSPPRRKNVYAPAQRDVDVSGGDVSEVAVELGEGGRVSGQIMVEGGATPQYGQVIALRIPEGDAEQSGETVQGASVRGGEFIIEGLPPGKFFLRPNVYGSGEGRDQLYVKSITWNGRDLLREPLEIDDGTVVEGVRVLFSRDPAKLNVRVARAGDKRPAVSASVFLVPANLSDWSPYSQELFCSTRDEGVCTISAPPGDYAVVALPRLKTPTAVEAEIRRRAAAAPRVTLRAGETKDFEVAPAEN